MESIIANNERDKLLFGYDHLKDLKERILNQKISDDIDTIQNLFIKGSCDETKLKVMFGTVDVKSSPNKATRLNNIFPVGPSLKPCRKYPVRIFN